MTRKITRVTPDRDGMSRRAVTAARRKTPLMVAALAVFAFAGLAACSSSQPSSTSNAGTAAAGATPSKIVIGVQSQDVQPEQLIQSMGWYGKHAGAPVSYANFNGGGAMLQAFRTGDLDMAEMGTPPAANGLDSGIPFKVVFVDNAAAKYTEGLVVRKSSGITSVQQLVGKTIATPSGSSADFMLNQVLLKYGIPPSKVNLLNLDPGGIGAAWKSGHIDAAYIWTPILQNLMTDGGRLLVTTQQLLPNGDFDGDVIVARGDFATKYPGAVVTFLKAMICANNFVNSRSPAALNMLSQTFSLPKSAFAPQIMAIPTVTEMQGPQFFGGSPPGLVKIMEKQAKFFYDQHLVQSLASDSTIESAVDGSFLAKAVQEVGTNFSCT